MVLLRRAVLAVRLALALTSALSGLLEHWSQRLEVLLAAPALRGAPGPGGDRWRAAFEAAPLGMAKVSLDGRLEA